MYIFAGPCSIDKTNIEDIYKIAEIKIANKPAIFGTRIVGLKSRTKFQKEGSGMGIDFQTIMKNEQILLQGGKLDDFETLPSVKFSKKIIKETNLTIATEIMMPFLQLPSFLKELPNNKVMLWNPSVNQLGWQVKQMGEFAKQKNWFIGLKNAKWIGTAVDNIKNLEINELTPIEKTWEGLISYSQVDLNKIFLIHRGFETENKGDFRARPVHEIAKRMKLRNPKVKILFDPSHSYGPSLRDEIVKGTIEAMKLKINEEKYLYDGILIEAGTSQTDTEQHITIKELISLVNELHSFRKIKYRA